MRQIAQNYKSGELALLDVPVPASRPGGVLVRTQFSLISTGTEMMKISESKLSLIGKARARPDQVRKVMQTVSQQGLRSTYRKVSDRLDSYTPLGYSLCGEVVEVGAGVEELAVGQRVACAGNLYALHAEYNWVPRNLCVPVPDGARGEHAAFTTVGAIAMQGYRQSEARLGETACVIGLGLVGQLLVQLLRAAGVNVVGLDPSAERCRLAEQLGAATCRPPDPETRGPVIETLAALTDGAGADHIFLTAGGGTNQPVELAAELARDRARVVDIGKCRLDLPWTEYYAKELDVRFSRSYGPGRYDPTYEEGGVDYPIGYVRWTERRNMACFLDLVAGGRLDLDPLISAVLPFDDAVAAYERIQSGEQGGVGMLFRYSSNGPAQQRLTAAPPPTRPARRPAAQPVVRLGVIGAGNYATSMLLPHLRGRADVRLVEVATATGLSATNAQRKFGFERYSTDHRGLLADETIGAVLIATRHHAHAAMVCEALRAGKAVFVEKPLAVDPEQLEAIAAAVEDSGNDRLMVGFNRRFAPLLVDLKHAFGARSGPVQVRYDVNAGRLDAGSWYAHPEEGSRLVGEGCHFVDTSSWWLDQDPVAVFAAATGDPDDTASTLLYPDGSVATIAYQTSGDPRAPKELLQVTGDGQVARLHNFQRTELWRGGRRRVHRSRSGIDKGQRQELDAFVRAVAEARAMPIPLASLLATTRATFAARRSLASRRLEA
ncbi:MAG TPA: bi-domain-containing oxidoreductase, partial [Actinomycetes bacterium]|nr:bi-domain-containing oxidoreductase [Actinomycetes bacterium]